MNLPLSRLLTRPRAVLLVALFAVLLLAAPALAQEGGDAAAVKERDNVFVHIIKSVGVFWIVLLPTSIAPAANVPLTDAISQNHTQFDPVFPYLRTPNSPD